MDTDGPLIANGGGRPRSLASSKSIDGYVADSLYPSNFHAAFTPARTDAILAHVGVMPPRTPGQREPFVMVDVGCGDGVGLIVNAAAHSEARFIGVDAIPGHIERGKRLAAEWGVDNIDLICATFDEAARQLPPDSVDYVQCQGVLAWVSEANRRMVAAIAGQALKPGGALTIGYNCQPGWLHVAPFQRMVLALATDRPGTPTQRFDAATQALRATSLLQPEIWAWLDDLQSRLPHDYFAHEYLNEYWRPLWASEAFALMAESNLQFVADANAARLRPDLCLKRAWRDALKQCSTLASRETAIDMMLHAGFRHDIYVKGAPPLIQPEEVDSRRMDQWWMATADAESVAYEAKTAAGRISFDNATARAIIRTLNEGPQPLRAVRDDVGQEFNAADLLNSIDALFIAGHAIPVEPPIALPGMDAFNLALGTMPGGMNALVTPHGAIAVQRDGTVIPPHARRRLGMTDHAETV